MLRRIHPRYLIPNGLTAASMVLGWTAIAKASSGNYPTGAWLIVWCVLLDRADGVAARWLGACSEFGLQFDTLADFLSFCVAPALLTWMLLTNDPRYAPMFQPAIARMTLLVSAGIYILCGALRLARFNIQARELGSKWFRGLPVTIAGALVATFLLAAWEFEAPAVLIASSPLLLLTCAVFMVSTLWLPKSLDENTRMPLPLAAVLVSAICALGAARTLPVVLLAATLAYVIIGFLFGASRNGAHFVPTAANERSEIPNLP